MTRRAAWAGSWRAAACAFGVSRVLGALAALVATQLGTNRAPGLPGDAPAWLGALSLRWDALHFAAVARDGYPAGGGGAWAFFPGFPLLARLLGGTGAGLWWAGTLLALASSFAALVLLHRLALVEGLGAPAATRAVWLLALFPGAFALGAFYSEGPFLLATVAAVYLARTGRWAGAGAAAAAATLTRTSGVLILVPLLVLAWQARPPGRRAAWLALAPAALAGWLVYAAARAGDVLASSHAQAIWGREFHGPLGAVPMGLSDAWSALPHVLAAAAPGEFEPPWMKLGLVAVLVFAVVATAGAWRRLGPAYGLYAALSLSLPLSVPWSEHPLMSLPRFVVVLFPLFLWLGTKPRAFRPLAALFAVGSAVLAARFGLWAWAG